MSSEHVERRLAAILAADVVGSCRLIGIDEEGTLAQLKALRKTLFDPKIAQHHGRIVKNTGDGALVEFASVVDAVRCADDVQRGVAEQNTDVPQDKRIEFRIGIHLGDIIIADDDIFGDGVNIAVRLEGIAEPGGICISDDAHRQVRGKVESTLEDMGTQTLKNIAEPMRAWRVRIGPSSSPATKMPTETAQPLALPDKPSIAVLPFQNMSGDPEQEYFADGIVEDIITALSKLRWFFVIARNSSFIYKGKATHLEQVADELGVRYVLEGSVRKSGDRVRITAQLNDVSTGSHVWAERYDRDLADVFAVQDQITEAIVAAIEPQLYAAENIRIRRKPPSNLDAWDLVMQALSYYWRVTRQDHAIAQDLLRKAIAIEPNYGQALGVLGASYTFGAHMGWVDLEAIAPIAERTALAAIRADSEDAWAHYALGAFYLITRRFDDSLAEFELALRLNPNFSQAQNYYSAALGFCGRWEEAAAAANRAIRLSPRDPFLALYYGSACLAQFFGRNYEEVIRLARISIRLRSDFAGAHRVLTAAAGMSDDPEVAAAALRELRRAQPNISLAWVADHVPIKHDFDREHYLEGFRRAGLE